MTMTVETPIRTDKVLKLQKDTVLISLTMGRFGQRKKLSSSLVEIDADRDLIKAQKVLLDCPEVHAIEQLDSDITTYLTRRALPAPFKRGIYMLPLAFLESVDNKLREFYEKRITFIMELSSRYEERVEEQRTRLRSAFDPLDYPPFAIVKLAYYFYWQYLSLEVPGQLPPALQEAEKAKMAEMWKEAVEGVEVLLRTNLLDLVTHLKERLGYNADGTPKIFRDSAIQNILNFLALLDIRNVTEDRQLTEVANQVQSLLNTVSADALRGSSGFRDLVSKEFEDITKALDTMITDAPRRRVVQFRSRSEA